MDEQRDVAEFIEANDLETPPAFRLLDLVSEVGELAEEANTSTEYGSSPADLELGDALFALLAVCEALEIDASDALADALEKYENRMEDSSTPGSGR
ncbi:MazG-like family protein [Natrinema caseinilyticum]|uniref:MazG-like family protein n=1 Tax=Natrinema caseinilyticum TaxID=2961570 RepID=UPI0020C3C552|nr:MazG-like family protein [Natrinema caseinilyticum]